MDMASLQEFLSTSRELGEPWPKKRKTDRSYLQWHLLERSCYADKKLCFNFPETSWDFSRDIFELQEKSNTHLSPNVKQWVPFKCCMNANLQSRLLGNISLIKKGSLENKNYSSIKDTICEFNENNNSLVTEPESWFLHAKEKEKSMDSGTISKENVLPTGSLISRADSSFTNRLEFQNGKNGQSSHDVYGMLNSREQGNLLKPVSVGENSMNQILHLCPPVNNFMKQPKSDLRSVFYEHNIFVGKKSNVLSSNKETVYPTNNTFRRNKVFKRIYRPYSKHSCAVIPKLVKCVTFESVLQDKLIYNYTAAAKKNGHLMSNHSSLSTTRWRIISKEKITNKCLIFSKDTAVDFMFSVTTRGKEQTMRYLVPSDNEVLSNNSSDFSALRKDSLYCLKPSLKANLRVSSPLNSVLVTSEKLSIKKLSTMKPHIQEESRKTFKENRALRSDNKHPKEIFRNINFISNDKYVSKYTATCGKSTVSCGNWEDGQENPCDFVDKKLHFSPFDTFKKICLNAQSDEMDQILFIDKSKFNDKHNAECSNRYAADDQRIIRRDSCTLIFGYISTNVFTNFSFLLEQESKECLYFKDTDANRQWQKCELNSMSFTSINFENVYKCFSDNDQHPQVATIFSDDHKDQSIFHIREKQNGFAFQQLKHVLQYPFLYNFSISNRLTHLTVQNDIVLFPKEILLGGKHHSGVTSVKQNAEGADKTGNVLEKSYAAERKQQNFIAPSFRDPSVGSTYKLIVVSSTVKQKHSENVAEDNFYSADQNMYAFELKSQFDLVLEELRLFNEISKQNGNSLVYRERNICEKDPFALNHSERVNEDSQAIYKSRINGCVSTVDTTVNSSMVKHREYEQCLFKDPVAKEPKEQEVPYEDCTSGTSDEELFYKSSEEHCDARNKQPPPWNSAFVYHTSMDRKMCSLQTERGNCLHDGITRVQPLKTCHGPLRVGLSRKAKPKQLHPYLK
ncbi:hypothetical protein JRQ81_005568 [Phrynocephalus forsythii]|uniref:RAD51 interacting motif domain-containing protein n=1 Tax=Phrynocephalus forsythii TaxID=171643 RepID=A0A9Q1B6U2_9SAUR|nr:hypothetical protein JRQ81_005568 [Phrynocephalus forsythii]